MNLKTGIVIFVLFLVVWIGGGIAMFGDSKGESPSQVV